FLALGGVLGFRQALFGLRGRRKLDRLDPLEKRNLTAKPPDRRGRSRHQNELLQAEEQSEGPGRRRRYLPVREDRKQQQRCPDAEPYRIQGNGTGMTERPPYTPVTRVGQAKPPSNVEYPRVVLHEVEHREAQEEQKRQNHAVNPEGAYLTLPDHGQTKNGDQDHQQ